MEFISNSHKKSFHSLSPSPTPSRFQKIHSRFLELSFKLYPKISPLSLKGIEQRSKISLDSKHLKKSFKEKDRVIELLHKDHIKTQHSCKIVVLPKSPFGKHKSYNEEKNFSSNHFIFEDTPDGPKQEKISKKIGLLNKRIKKSYCSSFKIKKKFDDHIEVFETKTGKLFCNKPAPLINIYDEQCEEYKYLNLVNGTRRVGRRYLSLKESRNSRTSVFSRLYSPSKKKNDKSFKKFEKLFETKVMKLD